MKKISLDEVSGTNVDKWCLNYGTGQNIIMDRNSMCEAYEHIGKALGCVIESEASRIIPESRLESMAQLIAESVAKDVAKELGHGDLDFCAKVKLLGETIKVSTESYHKVSESSFNLSVPII